MTPTTSEDGTLRLLVVSGSDTSERIVEFLKSWCGKGLVDPILVCDVTRCEKLDGEAPLIRVRSTLDGSVGDADAVDLDLINAAARDAGLVAVRGVLLYDHDVGDAGESYLRVLNALLGHVPDQEDPRLLRSGMVSVFAPYDSTTRFHPSAVNHETSAVVLSVEDRAQPDGGSGVLHSEEVYAAHVAGAVATIIGAWSGLDMPELGEFLSKSEDNANFAYARAMRHFVRIAGAAPSLSDVVDAAAGAMLGAETVELVDTGVKKVRGVDADVLVDDAVTRVKELDRHPISYGRPDTIDLAKSLAALPEQHRGAITFGWRQTAETFSTMAHFARGVTRRVTTGKSPEGAPHGWWESEASLPRQREAQLLKIVADQEAERKRMASERPPPTASEGMADPLRDALFRQVLALVDGGFPAPLDPSAPVADREPQPVLAQRLLAAPPPFEAPQLGRDLGHALEESGDVPAFDFWRRGGILRRLEPFRNQRPPVVEVEDDPGPDGADATQREDAAREPTNGDEALVPTIPEDLLDAEECAGVMYAWAKEVPATVEAQAVEGLDVASEYHLARSWYASVGSSFLGKIAQHLGEQIDLAAVDHRDSEQPPKAPEIADRLRRMRSAFQVVVWSVLISAVFSTTLALVLAPSPLVGLQRRWGWLLALFVVLCLVWLVAALLYERRDRKLAETIETFRCEAANQQTLHAISRSEYHRLKSVNSEFAPWAEILSWVINEPQPPVTQSDAQEPRSPFASGEGRTPLNALPNAARMARIELSDSFIVAEKRTAVARATQRGWLHTTFEDVLAAAFPVDDWDFAEAVEKVAMGERGAVDARGVLLRQLRQRLLAAQLREALTDRVRQWREELVPTLAGRDLLEMQVVDLESGSPVSSRQAGTKRNGMARKGKRGGKGKKGRKTKDRASTTTLQAFQSPLVGDTTSFSTAIWTNPRQTAGAHSGTSAGDLTGELASVAWVLRGLSTEGGDGRELTDVCVYPQDLILVGDDIKALAARVDVAQLEPPEGFVCFTVGEAGSVGEGDHDPHDPDDQTDEDDEYDVADEDDPDQL